MINFVFELSTVYRIHAEDVEKMWKNAKFLCCLTTFATLILCLGSATGMDDETQVVYDEHLFIAGNDSTGTAAITYASRFNPHSIIKRFENFSFPDSCAFHPSRCRNLTYLSSTTTDNNTQLIFYVPLTKSALGVMEFIYDGTGLSHLQTRAVRIPQQCNPISVINFFGALRLLCLGQEDWIMLCEVRNAMSVNDIWLSCSSPEYPINLSRLSNFIVYGNRAINAHIYFTYENAMYEKIPSSGHVNFLASLPPGYTYCWHLDFVSNSNPLIASYCYTSGNQIQVVYFNLNWHTFTEQSNASRVVSYHCPSPQTFVEVAIVGAFASFWQGGRSRGSFNIIGNSVSFARCFEFGDSLHFLYHDERLGTFIKPHISTSLRETVEQLSVQGCANPVCEQPLIFDNRYVLVQQENFNARIWTLQLVDIERSWNNSLLTFKTTSTSQLALISNFEHAPMTTPPASTTKAVSNNPTSNLATVIGTSVTFLITLFLIIVVVLLLVYFIKQSRRQRKRGSYSVVNQRNDSNSRQQSPTGGEMEMEQFSNEQNHEQSTSSSSSVTENVATNLADLENTVHSNPNNHSKNPEPTELDRENYGVIGSSSSMENVQRSGNSVVNSQLPSLPAPGRTSTVSHGNATTRQQSADSAQIVPHGAAVSSSSAPTASNTTSISLHSQHSNESVVNSIQELQIPAAVVSQATRPQSLRYNQNLQTSPGNALPPPPPSNFSSVPSPLRTNSTESNTSHTSCNSDGHISSATTPANGTPSSLMDLTAATRYTASQNSLHHHSSGHGDLPMDRNAYRAVGCSQEDVQRPYQCTQQPAVGQVSSNTNASAMGYTGTSSTASTPQQQYPGSAMGYTGTHSTSSTPQQHYPGNPPSLEASPNTASRNGMVPQLYSQWSGSGSNSVPDNSISATATFHSRCQSLTSTPPFVQCHNQATGQNFSGQQPPAFYRMDSNTSQNSGAGIHTPTNHSSPVSFPSTNQGSICPPSHVPLSAALHATNT